MKRHTELSDAQFLQQFRSCELDPTLFTHEAHLRLAYLYIQRDGVTQAESIVSQQLQRYVQQLGASDKYNATLTQAAIKAVHHFIQKSTTDTFEGLLHEFPRLKTNFKALMSCHYSFDIYTNDAARRTFLTPDLLPFE
ncbi:hypothetical protein [Aquimarina intermedia]|uniref:Uncharacterized protein n=1 Tax=Aquimarina intermedia TaxID=350814 RepID=A0A5S5BZ61_9FLAO|nr:hypothetical protein [Aquimarina intermedia]TYP71638.1 hypothetical protein BD809_10848 [Aquimarina intermedia]